jgi:hypothetical protein
MSFKCLGDVQSTDDPIEPRYSIYEKNSTDSRCLPQILAQNMPSSYVANGWIGESICENIIEEDESVSMYKVVREAN